ncbi:hypothetical protein CYY_010538 [Polysphondylium violaceum]|uniref:Uncharacterized protein n=1 Tax=Polysphondylium violaceum TaxID=133409 RepID=A0A8J4PKH9_9MYCE|nr:hypothetical protein CYY_010538 [Polysphondylium violaceum]
MVFPKKIVLNNPNEIPAHFGNVKIQGTLRDYCALDRSLQEHLPIPRVNTCFCPRTRVATNAATTQCPIRVYGGPILNMTNATAATYQSNNYKDQQALQRLVQKDVQPLFDLIQKLQDKAWNWMTADYTGTQYLAAWTNDASVKVICDGPQTIVQNGLTNTFSYEYTASWSVKSFSTNLEGNISFTFTVPRMIPQPTIALFLAQSLQTFVNRGLGFNTNSFPMALTLVASAQGYGDLNFYIPDENMGSITSNLVFAVIFIGLQDLVDPTNFRTRIQIFNWDYRNTWTINAHAFNNCLYPGIESNPGLIKTFLFPQRGSSSVSCGYLPLVYHNHQDQTIDSCQIAIQATANTIYGRDLGFSYAINTPLLGTQGQYLVGQSIDPNSFLEQAKGKYAPDLLTVAPSYNNVPVSAKMGSTVQGISSSIFNVNIQINNGTLKSNL